MSTPTLDYELMDLSPEEQEILAGGQRTLTGTIRVPRARFRYGGRSYPASIDVTVRGLPRPRRTPFIRREEEDNMEAADDDLTDE